MTKRFGDLTAVDRLNLDVPKGEVFGLVGPDGAGKTTTLRMLCGLADATSGEADVAGHDVREEPDKVKDSIGYMAQRFRAIDAEVMGELRTLFEGVSEEEAEFNPSPEEWSAKETLAHLIISEQYGLHGVAEFIGDAQREFVEGAGNVRSVHRAILSTTPTVPELLDRLERVKEEANTLVEHAEELKSRKSVLWRMGFEAFQYPSVHDRAHMEQIQALVEAARKG